MSQTDVLVCRAANLRTRLLPDGYASIMNESTDTVYTLTPLGAMAWEFCDGKHSSAEIAREISLLISAPDYDSILLQVKQLLAALLSANLVREV